MGQPPHFDIDGIIYFVTTRLKEQGRAFTEYENEIVERVILDLATQKEIVLYAYVIMPNHLHVLIKPVHEGISRTMQLIKGRSSRKINEDHFWQKGFFDFTILTEEKFREKFNYLHYNPVKRGLVEKAEDYKYSSAMRYRTKYGEVFYNQ
jgi:putative transposase